MSKPISHTFSLDLRSIPTQTLYEAVLAKASPQEIRELHQKLLPDEAATPELIRLAGFSKNAPSAVQIRPDALCDEGLGGSWVEAWVWVARP